MLIAYHLTPCMMSPILRFPSIQRENLGSPDSRVLDGEDLLDDVLIAPSNHRKSQTPTNEDVVSV